MQRRFFEADITKYWDMLPSPCGWRKKGGVTDFYKHFSRKKEKKEQTFPMVLSECKCHEYFG